jgi:hypothetical protein
VLSDNFEFRSTRNGTRVFTRRMADFQSVKSHCDSENLLYRSFPKSEKPIKAVLCHLPHNAPAEDIYDGLVSLGFEVVSIKQMTATQRSPPNVTKIKNLPLFLVTLSRTAKSHEIFRLSSFSHITIKVEVYTEIRMFLSSVTFASSSATSGQTAKCLTAARGEGGQQYKECPEKGNISSTPTCCMCLLAEGENPHPANYRGCRIKGGNAEKEVAEDTQDYVKVVVLFQPQHSRHVLRVCALRQDRETAAASDTSGGRSRHNGAQGSYVLTPTRTAKQVSHFGHKI